MPSPGGAASPAGAVDPIVGCLCCWVSPNTGTERSLALLQANPAHRRRGSELSGSIDLMYDLSKNNLLV